MALAPNEWAQQFITSVDERGMCTSTQTHERCLHAHHQITADYGKEVWFSTEPTESSRATLTAATIVYCDEGEFQIWTGAGNDTVETPPAAIFYFPERLANALRKRLQASGVQFDARRRWRMFPHRRQFMRPDNCDLTTHFII